MQNSYIWQNMSRFSSQTREPTIDPNILPRDPPSLVRDQQKHRIAHILNRPISIRSPRLRHLGRHHLVQELWRTNVGRHGAWANGVDGDAAVATQLKTKGKQY